MAANGETSAGKAMETDLYGFHVDMTPAQREEERRCDAYAAQRLKKWAPYKAAGKLPEPIKLKRYCRKGVPPELRPWVWFEVSGAAKRQAQHPTGYFAAQVEEGLQRDGEGLQQIDLDLPRTFPSHPWYREGGGRQALRRVLAAFAVHRPEVGYCQSMNFVAGLLLLAMDKDEEKVFWIMAALIDQNGILYRDMYGQDLAGCHVETRSLEALLSSKRPRLADRLASTGFNMSMVTTEWLLCCFASVLPSAGAARAWDSLLLEGSKVLYRVTLALLRAAEPALMALRADNPGDVMHLLKRQAASTHDRDRLMRDAFRRLESMPMARIDAYREQYQVDVDAELEKRRERRRQQQEQQQQRAAAAAADKAAAAENFAAGGQQQQVPVGNGGGAAAVVVPAERPTANGTAAAPVAAAAAAASVAAAAAAEEQAPLAALASGAAKAAAATNGHHHHHHGGNGGVSVDPVPAVAGSIPV